MMLAVHLSGKAAKNGSFRKKQKHFAAITTNSCLKLTVIYVETEKGTEGIFVSVNL
jgi:hypothetical protein